MKPKFNRFTQALVDKHGTQIIDDFKAIELTKDATVGEYKAKLKELAGKYNLKDLQAIAVMRDVRN